MKDPACAFSVMDVVNKPVRMKQNYTPLPRVRRIINPVVPLNRETTSRSIISEVKESVTCPVDVR